MSRARPTEPYAELWMGAHPDEPSVLSDGTPLDKAIAAAARALLLGAAVRERFGDRLPFLMKVLAAERPLSLQAHPTTEQARAGFAAEEAAGVPRDDPKRTFKDPFHKPELLLALTPFEALCGFRPVEESLHCLAKLQVPELKPTIAALARGGLRAAIPQLLALSAEHRERAGHAPSPRAAARFVAAHDPEFINTYRWAASLAETYPGDPGVVISLMCNHLKLAPGEAVFLPAGQPARLPLRGRRRGDGQLRQRAARRADRQARRPRRPDRGAGLHRRPGAGPPPGAGPRRAALPGAGRGLRPHPHPARRAVRRRSPPAGRRCCCAPRAAPS